MQDRENQLMELLVNLADSEPKITACAVLSSDAFPLASWCGRHEDEKDLSRFFSEVIAAAERAGEYFKIGAADRIYLKAKNGYLVVFQVNENAHLACALEAGARMDDALKTIKGCASKLAEVI